MSKNVSLSNELEHFVDQKVESGRYTSASEVVREGLRLLEEQDKLNTLRLQELEGRLLVGIDQIEQGKTVPAEKVLKELRRRSVSRRRAPHA